MFYSSKKFPLPTLGFDKMLSGYKYVTVAFYIAIILFIVVRIILNKTKFGYEIKIYW